MMTNMEYYREDLNKFLNLDSMFARVNGELKFCENEDCTKCEFWRGPCACKFNAIKWLMAEHKPEPTLTAREKYFVEFAEDGWLARDESGELFFYKDKPHKRGIVWWGSVSCRLKAFGDFFPFIKWKDEEPWSVEELRKLPVLEYNPEDVAFKEGGQDE